MKQSQSLEEVSKGEINPGQATNDKLLLTQQPVQLLKVRLEVLHRILESIFKGVLLIVVSVDKPDKDRMEVLVNSVNSCQSNLLIDVSANEFGLISLVADINADSVAFSDDLISVNEVGQGDCGVLLDKFRLILCKPSVPAFGSGIELLGVGDAAVFKQLPDSFREASDCPIAKFDRLSFHERYVNLIQPNFSPTIINSILLLILRKGHLQNFLEKATSLKKD